MQCKKNSLKQAFWRHSPTSPEAKEADPAHDSRLCTLVSQWLSTSFLFLSVATFDSFSFDPCVIVQVGMCQLDGRFAERGHCILISVGSVRWRKRSRRVAALVRSQMWKMLMRAETCFVLVSIWSRWTADGIELTTSERWSGICLGCLLPYLKPLVRSDTTRCQKYQFGCVVMKKQVCFYFSSSLDRLRGV